MKKITILSILVIIALVGQSMAQGRPGRGPGGPEGGRMQMWANAMRGIDLTEDQQAKMAEIRRDFAEKIEAAESDEARREVFTKMREEIHSILTPEQAEKLTQMRGRRRAAPPEDAAAQTAPPEGTKGPAPEEADKPAPSARRPFGPQQPMGMGRGFAGPGRGGFGQGMTPGRGGRGMRSGRGGRGFGQDNVWGRGFGQGFAGPGRGSRGMMQPGYGSGWRGMCPGNGICMMQPGRGFGQGMAPGRSGRGMGMQPGRGGRGFGQGFAGPQRPSMAAANPLAGYKMMLERIARHLELTDDQKAAIREIHKDAMEKVMDQIKDKVLNEEQAKKLDQVKERITRQVKQLEDKPRDAGNRQRGQRGSGQGRPGGARRGR